MMMDEVVIFDEFMKEIDWYDPVSDEPVMENGVLKIEHDTGRTYEVEIDKFNRSWAHRKREE